MLGSTGGMTAENTLGDKVRTRSLSERPTRTTAKGVCFYETETVWLAGNKAFAACPRAPAVRLSMCVRSKHILMPQGASGW